MRQWRLIDDCPAIGAYNMAVDEAIFESVSSGAALPTLRIYAWNPPCLSLGYGQKSSDVDFARAASLGWDVVRRPTGGRAILHTGELTYSLTLPADDDLASGTVVDSYRRISAALVSGFSLLGLTSQADRRAERSVSGPVCFETPSHYEITVEGRKLVGSAQLRRHAGILQHGSIPLTGDLSRICDALAYPDDLSRESAKFHVHARAITLSEALNRPISWRTLAAALIQGFSQTFDVTFSPESLTPIEQSRAAHLTTDIYTNPHWTRRR
ncbi:MAG: lipoate--protein ligase family protein [Chloroflexota bacterium]